MLQIYEQFLNSIKQTSPTIIEHDFIIAYISSPYPRHLHGYNNTHTIKVYFVDSKTGFSYSHEYAWDGLSSIFIGHYFNFLTKDSLTKSWKAKKALDKEVHKKFSIDLSVEPDFITLKQCHDIYGFYENLFKEKAKLGDLVDETLAIYHDEKGNVLIIPSIIIVQAFYSMSNENSLFDALTRPSGIKSMVHECTFRGRKDGKNFYYIEISGESHKIDIKMLFYFSYDQKHAQYFNTVNYQILNSKKILAPIPSDKGILNITAEFTRKNNNNVYLITNIIYSDFLDREETKKNKFQAHHRKQKKKKKKHEKRDTSLDKRVQDSISDGKIDDREIANSHDTELSVSAQGINLKSTGETTYEMEWVTKNEEEDRGGRIFVEPSNNVKKATFNQNKSGDKNAKAKSVKRQEEEPETPALEIAKGKNWFDEEVRELKKIFKVSYKKYNIPVHKKKKYTSSYKDNKKKQRRRYVVMKIDGVLEGKQRSFFYIDIEKDDKDRRKSALILNNKNIVHDVHTLIQQILFKHLKRWGKEWNMNPILKDKGLSFFTYRHSDNVKSSIQTLKNNVIKNF